MWSQVAMNDGKLIELVQTFPNIYDKKRRDFKDSVMKQNSWAEIGRQLNYSAADVQMRWKSLREKYVREKHNMKGASGSCATTKSTWDFYDSMRWLDTYIAERKTKSNNAKEMPTNVGLPNNANIVLAEYTEDECSNFSSFLNSSQPTIYIPSSPSPNEPVKSPESFSSSNSSASNTNIFPSTSSSFQSAPKNRKLDESSLLASVSLISKSMAERNALAAKTPAPGLTDDEKFCMALAAEMRKIPNEKRKRQVKKKLLSIVFDAADNSDDDL